MSEEEVKDEGGDKKAPPARDWEGQAKKEGWKPLDDWVAAGNSADDHIDAQTFVIRGDFLKDLRSRDSRIAELEAKQERFATAMAESNKAAREQGIKDAEARHRKAVSEGDEAAAQQALDDVKTLSKEPEPDKPKGGGDRFGDWLKKNDWAVQDMETFNELQAADNFLAVRNGGVQDFDSHMREVERIVRERLPEKFGQTRSADAEPTGQRRKASHKSDGYDSLPAHAKAEADAFVAQGLGKREDYVKAYKDAGGEMA